MIRTKEGAIKYLETMRKRSRIRNMNPHINQCIDHINMTNMRIYNLSFYSVANYIQLWLVDKSKWINEIKIRFDESGVKLYEYTNWHNNNSISFLVLKKKNKL